MKIGLVSTILKGKWAIDPEYAINSLPMISNIISGNSKLKIEEDETIKHAIAEIEAEAQGVKYNWYSGFNEAKPGSIAVIRIKGPVMKDDQFCGPMGMKSLGEIIKEAESHPSIIGMVLDIDSPGGTVDGTEVFANIIGSTKKPVVSYINGLMASAALWFGSYANEIMASTEMDEVGSVGVLLSFADLQPAYEKMGVKFHNVVSNLSPDKIKMFEDIRAGKYDDYKKEVLDPLAMRFQNVVRNNRSDVKDEHLTGKVYFAKDVMGVFVDSIGTLDDAVKRVSELAENKDQQRSDNTNNNQSIQMKKFESINKVLEIEGLEIVEGHASLNEEQLEALNNVINDAQSAKQTVKTTLENVNTVLNSIDESVENAEGIDEKVDAIITYVENIKKKPAGQDKDLAPGGDPKSSDGEKCTVKETDTDEEAIAKIADEFGIQV